MPRAFFITLVLAAFCAGADAQMGQPPNVAPAARFDPYKNFKFIVKWDGHAVPGISRVGALSRSTQVISVVQGTGGATIKTPGRTECDAVTLERGVTRDPAFEAWTDAITSAGPPPQSFRKDVEISIYDETGRQLLIAYKLFGCWPSAYVALSGLVAEAPARPVQRLTLTCTGWDRERNAGTGP